MDAFELLEKDHRKVEKIFEQLEPTTERAVKTREELFERLKTSMGRTHAYRTNDSVSCFKTSRRDARDYF
jgi:hypothetical protein